MKNPYQSDLFWPDYTVSDTIESVLIREPTVSEAKSVPKRKKAFNKSASLIFSQTSLVNDPDYLSWLI